MASHNILWKNDHVMAYNNGGLFRFCGDSPQNVELLLFSPLCVIFRKQFSVRKCLVIYRIELSIPCEINVVDLLFRHNKPLISLILFTSSKCMKKTFLPAPPRQVYSNTNDNVLWQCTIMKGSYAENLVQIS